jgi:hypothetical protein
MNSSSRVVRLPSHDDEAIGPVTIFDAEGHVLRVVPATEFHPPGLIPRGPWHERRRRHSRPPAASPAPE